MPALPELTVGNRLETELAGGPTGQLENVFAERAGGEEVRLFALDAIRLIESATITKPTEMSSNHLVFHFSVNMAALEEAGRAGTTCRVELENVKQAGNGGGAQVARSLCSKGLSSANTLWLASPKKNHFSRRAVSTGRLAEVLSGEVAGRFINRVDPVIAFGGRRGQPLRIPESDPYHTPAQTLRSGRHPAPDPRGRRTETSQRRATIGIVVNRYLQIEGFEADHVRIADLFKPMNFRTYWTQLSRIAVALPAADFDPIAVHGATGDFENQVHRAQ